METMHSGRRSLPPVPGAGTERAEGRPSLTEADADQSSADSPTERFLIDLTTGEQRPVGPTGATLLTAGSDDEADPGVPAPGQDLPQAAAAEDAADPENPDPDPAQQFVAQLRAAAPGFAAAARARSAVGRVGGPPPPPPPPPPRPRRARCRVVLRSPDSAVDVTFLGPPVRPGSPGHLGFDRQIQRWFTAGQRREDAWLVADPDAPDGLAVDLSAWVAAA